jgi:AraC-like DNA-binding protein
MLADDPRLKSLPAQRSPSPASARPKRREKVFGSGRGRPLDRNAKARVMHLARCLMRPTEKGRAYGAVTAKAFAVLEALLWGFHNAKSGLCFPGYETIAEVAGCARSTVAEAIKALEDAGVLSWVQRIKRVREACPDLLGDEGWRWRVLRTSNSYAFTDPSPAAEPPNPSKSENQPGTQNQAFIPLLVRAPIASDALEASLSHWSTGVQSRNGA